MLDLCRCFHSYWMKINHWSYLNVAEAWVNVIVVDGVCVSVCLSGRAALCVWCMCAFAFHNLSAAVTGGGHTWNEEIAAIALPFILAVLAHGLSGVKAKAFHFFLINWHQLLAKSRLCCEWIMKGLRAFDCLGKEWFLASLEPLVLEALRPFPRRQPQVLVNFRYLEPNQKP